MQRLIPLNKKKRGGTQQILMPPKTPKALKILKRIGIGNMNLFIELTH